MYFPRAPGRNVAWCAHRSAETRNGLVSIPKGRYFSGWQFNHEQMSRPVSGPQASRSIGNYLLSKTIGEGTFGKVKAGVHLLTGERVAVKVLEKDRIMDKGDIRRVTREIKILKHIRHPHVVSLLEVRNSIRLA